MKASHVVVLILVAAIALAGYNMMTSAGGRGGQGADALAREGLAWYQSRNPQLENLTSRYRNFGCHFEIEIFQGSTRIASLGWAGPGSFYVIGGR